MFLARKGLLSIRTRPIAAVSGWHWVLVADRHQSVRGQGAKLGGLFSWIKAPQLAASCSLER